MSRALDRIGLGTAQFGLDHGLSNQRGRLTETEARRTLSFAAESGLIRLDTAAGFGEAEAVVGRVAPVPNPFRLTIHTLAASHTVAEVEARARQSLRLLGVASAETLLVQGAEDLYGPDGDALWARMGKLKDEGLFEKIGVSARAEDSPVALARKFRPDVVQVPASLLDQRLVLRGDLAALSDLGVEIQLRSIFMQGLLFLPRDGLPTALASAGPRLSRIRRQIAEAGADPLQAALAYALQIPQVSSIVVGVASSAELRAIVAAALAPPPRLDWSELALDESTAGGVGLWAAA